MTPTLDSIGRRLVPRMVEPIGDMPGPWVEDASCAEVGGDLWFPENGDSATPAKRICQACPVRVECLTFALETRQQFGTWGGMTPNQRTQLRSIA